MTRDRGLTQALRQVAACEFELIEACHAAVADAEEETRGLLLHEAGAAQVHLFDVDNALRARGAEPVRYAACIRQALLSNDPLERIRRRRAQAYARLLARPDLGSELRRMVQLNLAEGAGEAFVAA
jgi:hypothetical protein